MISKEFVVFKSIEVNDLNVYYSDFFVVEGVFFDI